MKKIALLYLLISGSLLTYSQDTNIVDLSQDLLLGIKMNTPTKTTEQSIGVYKFTKLIDQLDTDAKKQAFWMNMYIAYSQKMLHSAENGDCNNKCRKQKFVPVGSRLYSLNDILYRFLLHSKCTVTGSKKLIVPDWEKQLRVSYPDGRILLGIYTDSEITSLVSYYEPENVDQQLKDVSLVYIKKYVKYDSTANVVYIPKWVKNFKREFQGKTGIISGLKLAEIIPQDANPTLKFTDEIPEIK